MEIRICIPVGRRPATPAKPVNCPQRNCGNPKNEETQRVTDGGFAEKETAVARDMSSI
jgi:hypothetical protein